MLKTAAQYELAEQRPYSGYRILTIPKIRSPRRQIAFTTSSAILSNKKLESSRIQSKCYSIKYRFISYTLRPCYEISIDISLIRSNQLVWESAGYRKSLFWT